MKSCVQLWHWLNIYLRSSIESLLSVYIGGWYDTNRYSVLTCEESTVDSYFIPVFFESGDLCRHKTACVVIRMQADTVPTIFAHWKGKFVDLQCSSTPRRAGVASEKRQCKSVAMTMHGYSRKPFLYSSGLCGTICFRVLSVALFNSSSRQVAF